MTLTNDLTQCYIYINKVSVKYGNTQWYDDLIRLKQCEIKPLPWWFPKRSMNAITWRPNLIYLTKHFFAKDIRQQSSILLHEKIHLDDWANGSLTWWKYPFNMNNLEIPAYQYSRAFLNQAQFVPI